MTTGSVLTTDVSSEGLEANPREGEFVESPDDVGDVGGIERPALKGLVKAGAEPEGGLGATLAVLLSPPLTDAHGAAPPAKAGGATAPGGRISVVPAKPEKPASGA